MSESVFETIFDELATMAQAVFKWVMLVAAIAAGTFIGLYLFVWFMAHRAEDSLKQLIDRGPFSTSVPSTTTSPTHPFP